MDTQTIWVLVVVTVATVLCIIALARIRGKENY